MPFDPNTIKNTTAKIEKHIANYEKSRKTVSTQLATLTNRLAVIERAVGTAEGRIQTAMQEFAAAKMILSSTIAEMKTAVENYKKPPPEYEMLRRRFIEAKISAKEQQENHWEKFQAVQKNKTDQKAAKELEIAEKAMAKINLAYDKIFQESESMVNAAHMKSAMNAVGFIPGMINEYEKTLKELLMSLKATSIIEKINNQIKEEAEKLEKESKK